jgi:hypothetical protein
MYVCKSFIHFLINALAAYLNLLFIFPVSHIFKSYFTFWIDATIFVQAS